MWHMKGTTDKNGEGSIHTVSHTGTQGMQCWWDDWGKEKPSEALGWGCQREADGSEVAGGEGHQKAKQMPVQGPPLSAVVFCPTASQEKQHWIASHAPCQAERYKSQPKLVIFSLLSPEMPFLTRSRETYQLWMKSFLWDSCLEAAQGQGVLDQNVRKEADASQGVMLLSCQAASISQPCPTHHLSKMSFSDCQLWPFFKVQLKDSLREKFQSLGL